MPRESPLIGIICLLEPKLSYISLYEPIASRILLQGTVPIIFGEGMELGGRVWYSVKARHNMYNVSVGTVTLYLCDGKPVKFDG